MSNIDLNVGMIYRVCWMWYVYVVPHCHGIACYEIADNHPRYYTEVSVLAGGIDVYLMVHRSCLTVILSRTFWERCQTYYWPRNYIVKMPVQRVQTFPVHLIRYVYVLCHSARQAMCRYVINFMRNHAHICLVYKLHIDCQALWMSSDDTISFWICATLNPLCAKFFRVNINIYLYLHHSSTLTWQMQLKSFPV